MPRYIDAEALENRIKAEWAKQEDEKGYGLAHFFVETQPTADVAPVVHAHWIPKKEMIRSPEAKNYNCSACGKESFAYPNCPFCRAIMDEEVKEDE